MIARGWLDEILFKSNKEYIDRLCSTFKWHKFQKSLFSWYCITLTSARIQYQPANEKTGEKYADRADFYVQLADDMMCQVDNTAQSEDAVISEGKHKYK